MRRPQFGPPAGRHFESQVGHREHGRRRQSLRAKRARLRRVHRGLQQAAQGHHERPQRDLQGPEAAAERRRRAPVRRSSLSRLLRHESVQQSGLLQVQKLPHQLLPFGKYFLLYYRNTRFNFVTFFNNNLTSIIWSHITFSKLLSNTLRFLFFFTQIELPFPEIKNGDE